MNARQKAKKYKKELERLKAANDPKKDLLEFRSIKPKFYSNKVVYTYDELKNMSILPMTERESLIKDRLLKPLYAELKNNMSVKLYENEEDRIVVYRTDIYIATERGD